MLSAKGLWVRPILGCCLCCRRMETTKLLCTVTGFAKGCYTCEKGSLAQSPRVHRSGGTSSTRAELGPAAALR